MTKKKTSAQKSSTAIRRTRLELPVHNLVGYGVLLVLALVVLVIVYSLQWYIIPSF